MILMREMVSLLVFTLAVACEAASEWLFKVSDKIDR